MPISDRWPGPLAGAAAVEPEAALVRRGRLAERVDRAHDGAPSAAGSSRPSRRRARTGSTRGGTARPPAAAPRAAPPSPRRRRRRSAVTTSSSGSVERRERVVAHRARTAAAAPRTRPSPSCRIRSTTPCAGAIRSTVPPYVVTMPCIPRQTPEHRPATRPAAPRARPRSRRATTGVPGPGRQHHVRVPQHLVGLDLVVLHDGRQHPGHRRDEMDQVPRVGVVVVHHHDVRGHALKIGDPGSSAHDAVHLEVVGQLDQVGPRAGRRGGPPPRGRASRPASR